MIKMKPSSHFPRAARTHREKYCDNAETAYWPIRTRSKIFPGDPYRKLSAWDVLPRPSDGHATRFTRVTFSRRRFLMFKVGGVCACLIEAYSRQQAAYYLVAGPHDGQTKQSELPDGV